VAATVALRVPGWKIKSAVPTREMNQKVVVAVVYVAAMFMTIMDVTIVNVALPTIAREFHTNASGVATTVIAFLVSLAVFIPASGWLGDRFGGRRVLLGSLAIFAVASGLCGFAHSLEQLVVFRVFQGVGGGLMTPVGLAMLFRVFPPEERVRAASILVIPTTFAPAIGPVIGGIFVTEASWRWVFFVNVPIGLAAAVFGYLFLADDRHADPARFDLAGFVLSGAGFGLVMYGVSEGPTAGWATAEIVGTTVSGAALLIVLVFVELRSDHPLLDLRIFGNRLFRSGSVVLMLGSMSFISVLYLLALFFQDALGFSALRAGLTIFPEALGVLFGTQFVSRLAYPRLGPRLVMATGLAVVASAMVLLTFVTPSTNEWVIRLIVYLLGTGMSGVFMPSQAASFATISRERTGDASSLFNAQRQIGSAAGVAVLTTVLVALNPTHRVGGHLAVNLAAYHACFLVGGGFAVLALCAALTIHSDDAASTMVRRRPRVAPAEDDVDLGAGSVA
jgi:EmrB/QacA subfamily drug resistance transporter